MLNRRLFISYLLSTITLPTVTSNAQSDMDDPVIIIGAGTAGITAAHTLHAKGMKTIILEARNRIGGRIHSSHKWQDATVDLGASWIHGITANPLTKIAKENNITMLPTDYDNSILYSLDGKLMPAADYEAAFVGLSDLAETAYNKCRKSDGSLKGTLERLYQDGVFPASSREFINFNLNTEIEHEFSGNVEDMHCKHFWEGDDLEGGDVVFPQGYVQILDTMTPDLDIRLNQVVSKVSMTANGVRVETDKGSIDGRAVIVTLPIGVLLADQVEFEPGLPDWKQDAINQIGSGLSNKTFLRFPKVFWDPEVELIQRVPEKYGEWAEIYNAAYYHDGVPILDCVNAGSFAAEVEGMTEKDIIASVMEGLRHIYGNSIPDPVDMQQSTWQNDPYALGAYSYASIDMKSDSRKKLAKPVEGRIFFAGEATSSRFPATVNGALETGRKAAIQVLKF